MRKHPQIFSKDLPVYIATSGRRRSSVGVRRRYTVGYWSEMYRRIAAFPLRRLDVTYLPFHDENGTPFRLLHIVVPTSFIYVVTT